MALCSVKYMINKLYDWAAPILSNTKVSSTQHYGAYGLMFLHIAFMLARYRVRTIVGVLHRYTERIVTVVVCTIAYRTSVMALYFTRYECI